MSGEEEKSEGQLVNKIEDNPKMMHGLIRRKLIVKEHLVRVQGDGVEFLEKKGKKY